MKKLEAKLILASKNPYTHDILYTWVLTYPRMILAEVNTHRVLSRNTSSSRAIPAKKLRAEVLDNPVVPISFPMNKKGMQGGSEVVGWRRTLAELIWSSGRYSMAWRNWALEKLGVHKQVANRLIEPWMWTQQLVSATEVENLFWLRDHWMAEPHFQAVAAKMHQQVRAVKRVFNMLDWHGKTLLDRRLDMNTPNGVGTIQVVMPGEWHLPFVDTDEYAGYEYATRASDWDMLKSVSAARCARVSYFLHENGKRSTLDRDLELFNSLAVREDGNRDPRHLSPLEHVATPTMPNTFDVDTGNFEGWVQFRKHIPFEAGPARG